MSHERKHNDLRAARAARMSMRNGRSALGRAALLLALAVLIGGLVGALPARRASAAPVVPGTATVRLTIDTVNNVSVTDPGCGDVDFYPKVTMNADPVIQLPPIEGDNNPVPANHGLD